MIRIISKVTNPKQAEDSNRICAHALVKTREQTVKDNGKVWIPDLYALEQCPGMALEQSW